MTPRWYGTVAALTALAALTGCADRSQVAATQPAASIAAPTALSRPSGGPLNLVATAPAPPPPTAVPASVTVGPASDPPAPTTAPALSASRPPDPTVAPDPTASAVTGPPGNDKPGPKGQLYSRHAAQLRLDADLAAFQLPKGAVRQTAPVPAVVNQQSGSMGGTVADLDTWWTVPGQ